MIRRWWGRKKNADKRLWFGVGGLLGIIHICLLSISIIAQDRNPAIALAVIDGCFGAMLGIVKLAIWLFPGGDDV